MSEKPPTHDSEIGRESGAASPGSQPLSGGEMLGSYQTTKALGRWLAFPPKLARLIGIEETIFLLNLAFQSAEENEWIVRSPEQLEQDTSLTYKQQLRVREHLESMGLIEQQTRRRIHETKYRVIEDKFDSLILTIKTKMEVEQLPKGNLSNFPKVDSLNLPNGSSLLKKEELQEYKQEPPSPKQEEQLKSFREKMEQLDKAKEERRARKQNKAAGIFQKPAARQNAAPAKIATNKQPESWVWFATLFKHLTDANAFSHQDLWPMVDEMLAEIGKEEAGARLSVFIDGSDKVSGYLARDFLAGGWRTINLEDYQMPKIVNED